MTMRSSGNAFSSTFCGAPQNENGPQAPSPGFMPAGPAGRFFMPLLLGASTKEGLDCLLSPSFYASFHSFWMYSLAATAFSGTVFSRVAWM